MTTSPEKEFYTYTATTEGGDRLDDSLTVVAVEKTVDCRHCSSCYLVPERQPYVGFACGKCISSRLAEGIKNTPLLYRGSCRACSITPGHGYLTRVEMSQLMIYDDNGDPNVACDDHATFCERHHTAIAYRVSITSIPIGTEAVSPSDNPRPKLGSPSSPEKSEREEGDPPSSPPEGGEQYQGERVRDQDQYEVVQEKVGDDALHNSALSPVQPSSPVPEGAGGVSSNDTVPPPRFVRYADRFFILIEELTALADTIKQMKADKRSLQQTILRLESDIKNACQAYGHAFQGFLHTIQVRSIHHPTREEFPTFANQPWYESYLLSVQESEDRLAELAHSVTKLKTTGIEIGIHPSRRVSVSQEEAEKPSPQDSTGAHSQHDESSEEKRQEVVAAEALPRNSGEVEDYSSDPSDGTLEPKQFIPKGDFVGMCPNKNCDYLSRVRKPNACVYQHNPRQYALNEHPEFTVCLNNGNLRRLAEMRSEIKKRLPRLRVTSPPRVTPKRDVRVVPKTCHVCNQPGHIRKNCPNRQASSSSPQGDSKVAERGSAITQPLVPKGIHIMSYRKQGSEDIPSKVYRPTVTYTRAGYPILPNVPDGYEIDHVFVTSQR